MNKIVSIFINQKVSIESVVLPHMDSLYSQALQYMGNKSAAEDLLQDVLVYVLEREAKVLSLEPVKPWLMRCLYHRFIDGYRKRKIEKATQLNYNLDSISGSSTSPEDSCFHQEILGLLAQLAPEQRVTVSLFDIEGYTLIDIVNVMGMPLGTVKSHLHRGRRKLKDLLELEKKEPNQKAEHLGGYKNELR